MKRSLLLLASLALLPPVSAQEKPRPNVLLICVDDLKPAIGAYGDTLAITPNLDRLAARGMRFDYAYCNQAVCAASRNNLLLGSRSTSLGIYDLSQNFRKAVPDAVTLPQYFMKNGYRAEAVGKILHTGHGNTDDAASWSVPTITEKVVEYLNPASSAGGKLTREEAFFSNKELGRIGQLPKGAAWEIGDVADNGYSDGRIADEGIKRLQAARERKDTPFFLALGFTKPHLPFTAPRKYWDLHVPKKFKLAENTRPPRDAPPVAGKRGGEITNYEPIPDSGEVADEVARKLIHGYYAATSYMDAQLGRVLDELDRQNLWDNTIIVLWGDHGWHLGDHGIWTKHTNYEQANRIPLLIVAPGMKPGSTRQLTETVDVYPTLAELAGLPKPAVPQPVDGLSLVPVLKDSSVKLRDHAYHCFPRGEGRIGRAIRTERYRFVEWKKPGAPAGEAKIELYDYQDDPTERQNLAAKNPEIVSELRAILARHPEAEPVPLARKK
ncbi:MAG: sulfatase [Verrucomicrobiota bacterium]